MFSRGKCRVKGLIYGYVHVALEKHRVYDRYESKWEIIISKKFKLSGLMVEGN